MDLLAAVKKTRSLCKADDAGIALQFTDTRHAGLIFALQREVGLWPNPTRLFLLGDSPYNSCCVDTITAQRNYAEVVFHIGESCFTPARSVGINAVHVLPDTRIDLPRVLQDAPSHNLLCFAPCLLLSAMPKVPVGTRCRLPRELVTGGHGWDTYVKQTSGFVLASADDQVAMLVLWSSTSAEISIDTLMLQFSLAYTDVASVCTLDLATSEFNDCSSSLSKFYSSRMGSIEKLRPPQRVGLLVTSLATARLNETRTALRQLLRSRGYSTYTVAVGSVNDAKVGNFPEVRGWPLFTQIDAWVVLACPVTTLEILKYFRLHVDKPIVTLWEMMVALDETEWSTQQSLNIWEVSIPEIRPEHSGSDALVSLGPQSITLASHDNLVPWTERVFHGIDYATPTQPATLEEGMSGTASKYHCE
ncbi:MAG: uncharacterized protein KVP18_003521 [Porospora cf. gigantea A]|uniref:uncharacterized protein n=1 Tax=Porospora cf. gigantea A TaxID=2853593 RepID=UPI00355A3B5E|nr:MAG: hypothetical protein KVP18_003521 [Porospora cf. gigantea A]